MCHWRAILSRRRADEVNQSCVFLDFGIVQFAVSKCLHCPQKLHSSIRNEIAITCNEKIISTTEIKTKGTSFLLNSSILNVDTLIIVTLSDNHNNVLC